MREEDRQAQETAAQEKQRPGRGNHPWVEIPAEDDSLGEAVRYSLDEIRYA